MSACSRSARLRRFGPVCAAALATAGLLDARAQETRFVDVRQGTDLAIALAPDRQSLVIDLLGGLWRLPASGGAATPLVGTEERAKRPQWSPDGRVVVYQRHSGTSWDVWALDTVTEQRWAVTEAPGDELEPTFLDGTTIVFAADRDNRFDLWSVDSRGGEWRLVVGGRGDARFPAVSERGDIAYVEQTAAGWSLRLWADGQMREVLASPDPLSSPSWRPGGGVLVFHETDHATYSRLRMLILSEDRVLRSLTGDEDVFAARLAWITPSEFLYTADGQIWRRRLAAQMRRPVHLFAAVSVPPVAPDAAGLGRASREPLPARGIAGIDRSQDGASTVFAALGDIWIVRDGELQALTRDAFWNADPVVAADGRFVVFASDRGGTTQLYRLAATGGEPEQLTFGPRPAFRPSLDLTGTRLAYLTAQELQPDAPATLNLLFLDDGTETRGGAQATLAGAERPEWLEAASVGSVAIVARTETGRARLIFDAALQPVGRDQAPERMPAALPDTLRPHWQLPAAQQPYVIQAGRLFDAATSGYHHHVDIHIAGERIAAIVGRNVLPLPERVIDATELTVIPGLVDAHVHETPLAGEWLGRAWLAHGVTTVRVVASDPAAALARAETWAAGRQLGPRLIVYPRDGAMADDLPVDYPIPLARTPTVFDDPGGAADAWRRGGAAERRLSPLFSPYQDVLGLVSASSQAEVTSLAALAPGAMAAAIERAPPAVTQLARRASLRTEGGLVPATATRRLHARQAALVRLIRSGARVAIGSEAPAVPPGLGVHVELALLVDAGVAPDQALRIATIGGAIALGLDTDFGTLEAGKVADLLVLSGDPLREIGATLEIRAVVKAGQWHEREALLAPTPITAQAQDLRDLSIQ